MPAQFIDAIDDPLLFERIESFGGGMDGFQRATLLGPDQYQYGENILIPDNLEARTRPGADSLGSAAPEDAILLSTAVLTAARNPVFITENVVLTAVVTSPDGTPTGDVKFYNGATLLGTGTLAAGVATLTTSFASIGTKPLKAIYQGVAGTYAAASSAVLNMLVYGVTFTAVRTATIITDPPNYHLVANAYDYGTVTLTLTDETGAALANLAVTISISGAGNEAHGITPTTNASGVISFTLDTARAEVKTITAACLGRLLPQTATLQFYPGAPQYSASAATIPPATVPADNATTALISIIVKDPNFNVCPGITVTITPIANCTISAPAATDANGLTSATIKSSTAGTKTVSVIVPDAVAVTYPQIGIQGTISPAPTVTFV